jgi:ABC-2 type transport system permease protein
MKALIHAEVLKLRSTRTTAWLLLATLSMVPLTFTVTVPEAGSENALISLSDPRLMAMAVGNSFGVPLVLMMLLGGVAFTQEFRYGTVTSTYLVAPLRTRVLVAKWVTLAIVSVVITTGTLVVAVGFGVPLVAYRGGDVRLGAQFWQMAVAGYVVMAVYGVIGVAIGALVRNQIIAVVGVLVWMLAVEQLIIPAYPSVGRWMPGATAYALMQLGPSVDPNGKLLSAPVAGVLLGAYVAAAVALALRLTPRRDVV